MSKYWGDSLDNKKIAFVCSGGVTKAAAWHLGVAMALSDMGLRFQHQGTTPEQMQNSPHVGTYVGSSAGCLIGLWLSMGHSPHEIIHSFMSEEKGELTPLTYRDMLSFKKTIHHPKNFEKFKMFEHFPFVLRKLISPVTNFSGFFTTAGLADYLKNNVLTVEQFPEIKPDLFIVATHLDHSRKVVFGKYNYPSPRYDHTVRYVQGISIVDAAAASMSVPPFYSPYPIRNPKDDNIEYFIDGEIRETLSTHVAIDNGCDVIFSSWTHTPYHFNKEIGSLAHYGLPAICIQSILLMIQKKIMSSRERIKMKEIAINEVNQYMIKEKFSEKHRKDIMEILESKLDYKPHIKMIDIYPDYDNYELFFSSSFSLSTKVTHKIVRMAYKRTIQIMRKESWD